MRKIGRQSTFLLNFIISLANTFLCFLHGLALPLPAYPIGPRYTQLRSTNLGLSFYNEPMQTFPSWNFTLTTVSTMLFKQNSQLGLFRYNEMHVYIRVETRHHYATFYVKTRFEVEKKGEKLITTTTTNNRAFTREFIVHTSRPRNRWFRLLSLVLNLYPVVTTFWTEMHPDGTTQINFYVSRCNYFLCRELRMRGRRTQRNERASDLSVYEWNYRDQNLYDTWNVNYWNKN